MKRSKEGEDGVVSGIFTWVIEDFSKIKNDKHYSDVFIIAGFKWRILLFPKGTDLMKQLSLYLGVADASILAPGWARFAHFSLRVINQLDTNKSITIPTTGTLKEFNENKRDWGFKSFMPLCEFYDCNAGYLVNDKCIIEAKVDVKIMVGDQGTNVSRTVESSNKKHKGQEPSGVNSVQSLDSSAAPKTPCSQSVPPFEDAPCSEQVCTRSNGDSLTEPSLGKELGQVPTNQASKLMEFRGLGLIEKAFVPLLEEVCSLHPSMIECLKKRSRKVTECAFTALGGLLHFLKTTKVKDMTEETCLRLQYLWEDLQMFKFDDLAWLEPHVQSALSMKQFLEREKRVKRLREDVDVLDNELKRRSTALAVTEVDLEVAKRDLKKEEEDFVAIDMDSELGYGMC